MKAPRLSSAAASPSAMRSISVCGGRPAAQLVDGRALLVGGELVDQGMLGRQHGVGHAEAGVGAGGEDPERQVRRGRRRQVELGALGAPDPVALHGLDPLGPVEVVERVEQLVGVVGDAEEPLLEVAFSTRSPERSHVPSGSTCSLASTVWQPGHQLTGALAR